MIICILAKTSEEILSVVGGAVTISKVLWGIS